MSFDNVSEYLKNHDIKPSYQRIKIFEYLYHSYQHPKVDTIFKALSGEIPTLSKTTVYNTLNLFIDKGIVNIVTIEENETRYDANISIHGHFKCEKCDDVIDFDADVINMNTNLNENYKINQRDIFFRGICEKCMKERINEKK
jgi:Fe2+ or Zn2+ uptake regulation protein